MPGGLAARRLGLRGRSARADPGRRRPRRHSPRRPVRQEERVRGQVQHAGPLAGHSCALLASSPSQGRTPRIRAHAFRLAARRRQTLEARRLDALAGAVGWPSAEGTSGGVRPSRRFTAAPRRDSNPPSAAEQASAASGGPPAKAGSPRTTDSPGEADAPPAQQVAAGDDLPIGEAIQQTPAGRLGSGSASSGACSNSPSGASTRPRAALQQRQQRIDAGEREARPRRFPRPAQELLPPRRRQRIDRRRRAEIDQPRRRRAGLQHEGDVPPRQRVGVGPREQRAEIALAEVRQLHQRPASRQRCRRPPARSTLRNPAAAPVGDVPRQPFLQRVALFQPTADQLAMEGQSLGAAAAPAAVGDLPVEEPQPAQLAAACGIFLSPQRPGRRRQHVDAEPLPLQHQVEGVGDDLGVERGRRRGGFRPT